MMGEEALGDKFLCQQKLTTMEETMKRKRGTTMQAMRTNMKVTMLLTKRIFKNDMSPIIVSSEVKEKDYNSKTPPKEMSGRLLRILSKDLVTILRTVARE